MVRELRETMYQWTRPFLVDPSKYRWVFGPAAPTPHREAVVRTVACFRDQAPAQR